MKGRSSSAVFELLYGRWQSQALYAGVKLGIFDAIGDGPKASAAIAQELGLDTNMSYRLLRALCSIELLEGYEKRRFAVTPAGTFLRSDHPQSLRNIVLLCEGPAAGPIGVIEGEKS